MDNRILFALQTTGAGRRTAQAEGLSILGVPASEAIARKDLARVRAIKDRFDAAAMAHDLPSALLAGIASRESHIGASLRHGMGDRGYAFGIMQIDRRYHTIIMSGGPDSETHISQAAGILSKKLAIMLLQPPIWPPEWELRGAVAAYNMGPKFVRTQTNMDAGSTGGDYSADVWARARFFASNVEGWK